MKRGLTTLSCAALLLAGLTSANPANAQLAGTWDSNYGAILLNGYADNGYGGSYDNNRARLWGNVRGSTLYGHWIRNSGRRCLYRVDGSYYWGRAKLRFSGNGFEGTWGYCNDKPTMRWSGSRRFGGGFLPGIPAAFQPNLNRIYSSNYGTINWARERYGDRGYTLRITNRRWDLPSRKYFIEGTWNHNNGTWGYFEFFFSNSCTFDGLWWHRNKPQDKKPWNGNCRP